MGSSKLLRYHSIHSMHVPLPSVVSTQLTLRQPLEKKESTSLCEQNPTNIEIPTYLMSRRVAPSPRPPTLAIAVVPITIDRVGVRLGHAFGWAPVSHTNICRLTIRRIASQSTPVITRIHATRRRRVWERINQHAHRERQRLAVESWRLLEKCMGDKRPAMDHAQHSSVCARRCEPPSSRRTAACPARNPSRSQRRHHEHPVAMLDLEGTYQSV
jgi:hypothetical protein